MKFLFLATACLVSALFASAQIIPKKIIQKKTNDRVNQVISKTTDRTLDSITTTTQPKKNADTILVSNPSKKDTVKPVTNDQPSLQSYTQYDFVPGDSVLYYEDFSQDAIGDFPASWTTNKSGEVSTLNVATGNWLNLNATEGNWWYLKEISFPKNFIVEFDVVPKKGGPRYAVGVAVYGENGFKEMSDPNSCKTGLVINVSKTAWEAYGLKSGAPRISGNSALNLVKEEKVNHVIIWVQNRRVRIYFGGAKVLDMPTILYDDSKFTRLGFMLYRGASSGSFVGNIKVTTASPDNRSKLLTTGKLVTYGIYFDVNKSIVKAESYGTLKNISQLLQENPAIRIKIVGHTDADGDDASNLDLSKRRAASVKNELVNNFGIDGSRIETDGKGETQPIASNNAPSNKALNRRVELIKL